MRVITLLTVLILSAPLAAVDGINLPGSDYKDFVADSAAVCRNSCGGDPRCQAYTWVKPGIQGPGGHCWLKFRVPTLVRDACCDSGSRENIDPSHVRAEDKTDRPGLDYTNFETDSWTNCEASCKGDGRCAAWSYARRGVQGPRGRCWLKGQVPNPVSNAGVVSGVKFRPRAVPID